jgi:predicted enzyme related to lactoylglutathione lyase
VKVIETIFGAVWLVMLPSAGFGQANKTPAPIVYFDIAGPPDVKQAAFYEKVFGWNAGPGGVIAVPVTGPRLPGTLRADPAGKVIYIGVPDIASTLKEIVDAGGKVVQPRFEVKGVVILGLFKDPAGNIMGLVELAQDGKPKIP